MRTIFLAAMAIVAMNILGSEPAQAYHHGRWCAVFTLGPGGAVERCHFRDLESCRSEIIAGNRGFCRPNGYWDGRPEEEPRQRRRRG
jgi:Protein of unknown function (DUF3551)